MPTAAISFLTNYLSQRAEAKANASNPDTNGQPEAAAAAPAVAVPAATNINASDAEQVAATVKKPPSSGGGSGMNLSSFKVPMGITGLLIFILFILFAIKPADGHTESRLMLLWKTIYKGGALQGSDALAENTNGMTEQTSGAAYVDPVLRYV
jgi:hypothetical protein